MYLVMRLNGEEVEKELLLSSDKIQERIAELRKKHAQRITSAGVKPEFYVDGISSSINQFKSLSPGDNA